MRPGTGWRLAVTGMALLALVLQGLVPLVQAGESGNGPGALERDLRVICTAYGFAVVDDENGEDAPGSHLDCPVCQSPDSAAGLPGPGPEQTLKWSAPAKMQVVSSNGGFAIGRCPIRARPRAPPTPV